MSETILDELENPTFEGPSIANLSSDFEEKVDLNSTTRRRNGLIPRRQKTLEGPYCSDTDSSIIDDSIEAIQLRFNYEHYGGLRPFEQFQRIRNHSYAFDLLRQKRGDAICQELHTFLKTVDIQYPFGVRQTTLERAIEQNDRTKFKNINFSVLEQYFTLTELSKLPGTSTQYMTGGMWVRGDIRTYDEKKYKGLERLHDWERDQWMVPRCRDFETQERLNHHMKEVFSNWNFDQETADQQDEIAFCINWYFRQIVAELVHLHDVYHSRDNQDPMNKYSIRRYAEENVYSLSETMAENLESCAALVYMESVSDSIGNHEFKKVFQCYNIQRPDLTDHYQICKKIVHHKMYRQEFRVQEYPNEFNVTSEDYVEFTDFFMADKIRRSPNILFEMAEEDALSYEDSQNWNENSLQIFRRNRRQSDGFCRDKGLVAYVSACNEVSVQVQQSNLKDIETEFKKYHATFMPEAENKLIKFNSRTAFYGCFPYSLVGREHLIRPGLMVAAWVNFNNEGEWNRAIVTEVIDCPDSLHSRLTNKKPNRADADGSFYTKQLKIHLIDWGYELESNAAEVFLLPNSETFLLSALAIRCYIGPSTGYKDVKIEQNCNYGQCKLYVKTTENLGSDERHRLVLYINQT